jgi:hypothetical protein
MLTILKYELQYLRFNLIPTFLPPAAMLALLIFGAENVVNGTSYILCLAIFGQLIGVRGKEKRSFREIVYPLTRKQISIARSLFIYIPIVFIYCLALIAHIFFSESNQGWHDSIYELSMMHGLIIMMGHLYYFFSDSFSVFTSNNGKLIFNIITISVLLVLIIMLSNAIESSFMKSYFSGIGSIIFLIVAGFVLAYISRYSFNFRESLID